MNNTFFNTKYYVRSHGMWKDKTLVSHFWHQFTCYDQVSGRLYSNFKIKDNLSERKKSFQCQDNGSSALVNQERDISVRLNLNISFARGVLCRECNFSVASGRERTPRWLDWGHASLRQCILRTEKQPQSTYVGWWPIVWQSLPSPWYRRKLCTYPSI